MDKRILHRFKTAKIGGYTAKKSELDNKLQIIGENYDYYINSMGEQSRVRRFLKAKYLEEIWYTEEPPQSEQSQTKDFLLELYHDNKSPYELAVEEKLPQWETLVIRNLTEAMNWLFDKQQGQAEENKLSLELIKEVHKIVVKDIESPERAGEFATTRRYSTSGMMYTIPQNIEPKLKELIATVNDNLTSNPLRSPSTLEGRRSPSSLALRSNSTVQFADAVKTATYFLNRFLKIHPFHDGNGRVARLLFSYILNTRIIPPVSLVNQWNYNQFLEALTKANEWHIMPQTLYPLLEFVTNRLIESLIILYDFVDCDARSSDFGNTAGDDTE